MKPKRIQRRRAKGWRMPANTVNVTRPGKWGNPFVVGKFGTTEECIDAFVNLMNGMICASDSVTIEAQKKTYETIRDHIEELRGHNLACFCREGQPCHGDILLKIANA